jgi:hypothetical protein
MLKRRILVVEKRLVDLPRPNKTALRIVEFRDGDPEPQAALGEQLLILHIIDPRAEDLAKHKAACNA